MQISSLYSSYFVYRVQILPTYQDNKSSENLVNFKSLWIRKKAGSSCSLDNEQSAPKDMEKKVYQKSDLLQLIISKKNKNISPFKLNIQLEI